MISPWHLVESFSEVKSMFLVILKDDPLVINTACNHHKQKRNWWLELIWMSFPILFIFLFWHTADNIINNLFKIMMKYHPQRGT